MSVSGGPDIVENGLVLCLDAGNTKSYPGSGTVWTDLSRSGNNGTLTNGPTFSSANGGSIVFDGSDDYVNCGSNISTTFTNLSIETIVKIGAINKKQGIISTYNNSPGNNIGWGLELTSGNAFNFFGFTSNSVANGVATTFTVSLNQIYQVNCVFIGSTSFNIYINGVYNNTTSVAYTSISKAAAANLMLGKDDSSQIIYFGGNIFNAKIYNRALSASEIRQNYNATKGRFRL